jgi:hypothetical protein
MSMFPDKYVNVEIFKGILVRNEEIQWNIRDKETKKLV